MRHGNRNLLDERNKSGRLGLYITKTERGGLMTLNYEAFIEGKRATMPPTGFTINRATLHESLFDFQKDIVRWALRRGRAAVFAGTGLGKTRMQIEWARNVRRKTGGNVLLLAPLAVASQTVREGEALGYKINLCRSQEDVKPGLNITNYEMLKHFDAGTFEGVVLDESSILKSFTGKVRTELIESFANTPFRLACTATPAPNDFMEIGNHAEFLGVMNRTEMLSMFFVHDGGDTSKWRLKGHAEDDFWQWVASWGVVLEKPSDLGYADDGYDLPPLTINDFVIEVEGEVGNTLSQRQKARRETIEDRVKAAAEIVNASDQPFLVWCDLNDESAMLKKLIPDAVEVKGSDKPAHKEKAILDFAAGKIRVLVTKPSIAGFGMNWQHCADMAFVGLSDSFEQVFQAIRRCYRFGQTKPVNVHMITSSREGATAENIKRKEADFKKMVSEMVQYTKEITSESIRSAERDETVYEPETPIIIPAWLVSETFSIEQFA
jgi:superfamily II DNA or RNA helicase